MYQENVVLCGASAYEQKYYFNKDFDSLPDHVKKELQIMCVLFTEEIGGIFTLEFDDHGNLQFKTEATEADGFYDCLLYTSCSFSSLSIQSPLPKLLSAIVLQF